MRLVDHIPLITGALTSDSESVRSNRLVRQWLVSDLLRRVTDTNNLRLLEPDITGGRVMGAVCGSGSSRWKTHVYVGSGRAGVCLGGRIAGFANLAVASTVGAAQSWPLLTNVSLGTGTQIDSVDFVSQFLGYGIASNSYEGSSKHVTEPFYLVSTTDQGTRWRLGPRVPLPPNSGAGPYRVPLVDFIAPSIGYVGEQEGVGGDIQVTTDAGAHWAKLRAPGVDEAFAVSGATAAVVTSLCHNAEESNCSAQLSLFHEGSVTPYESHTLPLLVSARTVAVVSGTYGNRSDDVRIR